MYAANFTNVSRAKLLLERGARVLLCDDKCETAFDHAFDESAARAEFVALLEQAAKSEDPDAQDLETAGRFVGASSSPQNAAEPEASAGVDRARRPKLSRTSSARTGSIPNVRRLWPAGSSTTDLE